VVSLNSLGVLQSTRSTMARNSINY
jgi:hypothetical protein